jgi:signal transduction histidine kinase
MPLPVRRTTPNGAVESERRRIARAIHDSVTQEVAVVIWQLRLACRTAPKQFELFRALEAAETAMGHLRALMRGLRSREIGGRGAQTGSQEVPPPQRDVR